MANRIPQFLAQAREVQSSEEASRLTEAELDWIYANNKESMTHKEISGSNGYRVALKRAGLTKWFLERPVEMREDGVPLQDMGVLPGFFRERAEAVAARRKGDEERWEQQLEADSKLLIGHEQAYLDRMMQLLRSRSWNEIAVGIEMATGRRNVEAGDTARMTPSPKGRYWVQFSGQAKTGSAERAAAVEEIAILAPNDLVCPALERLHTMLRHLRGDNAPEFDGSVGRDLRRTVDQWVKPLFTDSTKVSPRSLRNFYVAIFVEAITPEGEYLCPNNPELAIGHMLGHKQSYRPSDAYKRYLIERQRRNIVLPK